MIKNIIFDIGNVLLHFKPEKYLEETVTNRDIAQGILKAVFLSNEWVELDRGSITLEEAVDCICKKNPDISDGVRQCMGNYFNMFTPIIETVEILGNLKKIGYKLFYLSNFHLKAFNYVFEKYDFFKYFDGGIVSSKVLLLKPQKEIYERLVSEYGLIAGETLFVDDTWENIKGAEVIGLQTLHYKNADGLLEALSIRK